MQVPVPMGVWANGCTQVDRQDIVALSIETEQSANRLQQCRATAFLGRVAQGRDWPVQELVLIQPEGRLDVLTFLGRELAIETAQERINHFTPTRLEFRGEPGDQLPIFAPTPVIDKSPRL